MQNRLLALRIQGFRCLEDLMLSLEGLQFLIGENGSGKSTIVEAFEILRRLALPGQFTHEFLAAHGDLRELVRSIDQPLALTALIQTPTSWLEYAVELKADPRSNWPLIAAERVTRFIDAELRHKAWDALVRVGRTIRYRAETDGTEPRQSFELGTEQTSLHQIGTPLGPPEVRVVREVLESLEVFPSIDVAPMWAHRRDLGPVRTARTPSQVGQVQHLSRDASNLASVFLEIMGRSPEKVTAVLHDVRAGLGLDVTYLAAVPAAAAQGLIELKVRFGARDVPASQLSQGQLSYLALVAIKHLEARSAAVVFDEPELHLHPGLLVRAAWLLQDIAKAQPVVVATHSDAFLEALENPEDVVRVLTLDTERRASINRVDAQAFARWKTNYSNLAELRRGGFIEEVLETAFP